MSIHQVQDEIGLHSGSLTDATLIDATEGCAPGTEPNRELKPSAASGASVPPENTRNLLDVLAASRLYREYERAFTEAIGVPLTLRAVESWQLPYHGKRGENPYCAYLAAKSRSCAACLRTTQRLSRLAAI